jgi:sulfonate transport system substrate-binding protein
VVTEEFQQKYPEATARVTRGLVKAAYWLGQEENREEAYSIWARTGVTREILREEFQGTPLKEQFNPLLDDFLVSQYRGVIAFNKDQKLIRYDVDFSKWVEPKYLDAALAALNLKLFWSPRNADGLSNRPLN